MESFRRHSQFSSDLDFFIPFQLVQQHLVRSKRLKTKLQLESGIVIEFHKNMQLDKQRCILIEFK